MKKHFDIFSLFFIIILFTILINCSEKVIPPDDYNYSWPLKTDSMNLGVLILDFETYAFEGGHFKNLEKCYHCTSPLPFNVIDIHPVDYGDVTFTYAKTGDTLFYATVIWHGTGSIIYPNDFLSPDKFVKVDKIISEPNYIEVHNPFTSIDTNQLELMKDTAWNAIQNLDIVADFSQKNYTAGFFLYPPTVGLFNPRVAKWVIFLWR